MVIESKVYLDELEHDELEPLDINLEQKGKFFEDTTKIGIPKKQPSQASDESFESVERQPPTAQV